MIPTLIFLAWNLQVVLVMAILAVVRRLQSRLVRGSGSGVANFAYGYKAGFHLAGFHATEGSGNLLIGPYAGENLITGSFNLIIGSGRKAPSSGSVGYIWLWGVLNPFLVLPAIPSLLRHIKMLRRCFRNAASKQ